MAGTILSATIGNSLSSVGSIFTATSLDAVPTLTLIFSTESPNASRPFILASANTAPVLCASVLNSDRRSEPALISGFRSIADFPRRIKAVLDASVSFGICPSLSITSPQTSLLFRSVPSLLTTDIPSESNAFFCASVPFLAASIALISLDCDDAIVSNSTSRSLPAYVSSWIRSVDIPYLSDASCTASADLTELTISAASAADAAMAGAVMYFVMLPPAVATCLPVASSFLPIASCALPA